MNKRQTIHTIIDKRYKILRKIGAGATGIVYRVEDLKSNKIIALKILSKQKISSEAVQRFKREFQLLTQLHHPNLCSVYDFGTFKSGRSYFTMEYIDGKDIFTASKGLSHEKLYEWIVQLCRALEYIHAKGLIHYDIKPGNVLIAKGKEFGAEGENCSVVKLMDFGLAGEQWIKGGVLIKGTFPYIAPEVIEGLGIDHRVDLYSLGVLLYELFTQKPFQEARESFVSLLQQRRERGTRLPSKVAARLPKRLKRLLMQLLAFKPAQRLSRANEVIKEINTFSRVKFELETKKTLEGYLLSSRFVGRNREMAVLQSLYERASRGKGNIALITGDAGIGKSRLLSEFRIFTQLQRSHSFTGYVHQKKTGPLEPFYDIFKELINYITDSTVSKISLAVLLKLFPDLADSHLRRSLPKLVPLGPQQERLRTFEALTTMLQSCAKTLGGLVILLEDLHWADDLTILFLEYIGRNIIDSTFFICGTTRQEELKEHVALQNMIRNLKDKNLHCVELKPLTYNSLYSFLDSTITSGSNSPELVRYLMKKTGGNPYFVEEMMRTLLQKKRVSIGERIGADYFYKVAIPKTIEDIVVTRVKGLDIRSQRVIKIAAVLLKGFAFDMMKRLTRLDDTALSMVLWELKSKQVLVEQKNQYHFYHATLREAVNKRLSYREKRKLNYHVGQILECINKKNPGRVVEDLALYFINARDRKKGVFYGLGAAKKSSKRYAYEQAISFYRGVLNLLPGKEKIELRFDILQRLAHIEQFICYYDDAIKHYNEALILKTGTIDKKIRIHVGIGIVYENKGKYKNALRIYKKSLRLLRKMNPGRLRVLLQTSINIRICRARLIIKDYEGACKFNFDTIRLPKEVKGENEIRQLGSIYQHMGIIELYKGEYSKTTNYDKIISYYKKAYKYYKRVNAEDRIATILTNLGVTYYRKYDLLKAVSHHQKAIQISQKIGNEYGVMKGLYNVSDVLKTRGYYSEAIDNLQKALFISKKLGDSTMTGFLSLLLGSCLLQLCDHKNAEKSFERALKIFDVGDMKPYKVYPIWTLGRFYCSTGKYTLALRFNKKALRIFKDMGNQFSMSGLFIDIGSVLIEIGEFSKAKRYIKEALKFAIATGLQDSKIECYIALCRINIMMGNYELANYYYEKGIKIAKPSEMKQYILQFFLLISEIYYQEKKYLKGIKIANKAIQYAKEMGTIDLYVDALLLRTKNEIEVGALSKREITKIMEEAVKVAQEIDYPEILWKAYFEYGNILQSNCEYRKALDYYQQCIEIFVDVSGKIKSKSYRQSYLHRYDRRAVFNAVDMVEKLI